MKTVENNDSAHDLEVMDSGQITLVLFRMRRPDSAQG